MSFVLINKSENIPDEYFDQFIDYVRGDVVLVIDPDYLPNERKAYSISYKLKGYSGFDKIIDMYNIDSCDTIIFVQQGYIGEFSDYPIHFSFVIGHELGHAKTIFENIDNHVHGFLVDKWLGKASEGVVNCLYHLPYEKTCDQFGIYVSEKIYSREALDNELKCMINNRVGNYQRLSKVLEYESTNDFSNLRKMLIDVSLPYKDRLIEIWKADREANEYSMTHCIDDYDALFVL